MSKAGLYLLLAIAVAFIALLVSVCADAQQEIRIDLFDSKSQRQGYIIVNPSTGRLDQFDRRGNRLGYGTLSSPPSTLRDSTDSTGRSILDHNGNTDIGGRRGR